MYRVGGVLVTADGRASSGAVFHEARRIRPAYFVRDGVEYDPAVAGGAGDAAAGARSSRCCWASRASPR
ncbi:MAG TPA: hypothetical protein EYP33_01750 [Pyrodictium sp.]|nr:hypothetical protein [Pyrodictium sp.]